MFHSSGWRATTATRQRRQPRTRAHRTVVTLARQPRSVLRATTAVGGRREAAANGPAPITGTGAFGAFEAGDVPGRKHVFFGMRGTLAASLLAPSSSLSVAFLVRSRFRRTRSPHGETETHTTTTDSATPYPFTLTRNRSVHPVRARVRSECAERVGERNN